MKKIIFSILFIYSSLLYSNYYNIDEWYINEKIDPINDEKDIYIFINKKEENILSFNTFIININKEYININIYTPSLIFKKNYTNENNKIDIIYRLDKNEPRNTVLNKYGESEFYSLTSNQFVNEKSIILLKELLSSDILAVRAIEKIENTSYVYTYVYDLKPLRNFLLTTNFEDTILENYRDKIVSIIVEKQENYEEIDNDEESVYLNDIDNTNKIQ